MQTKEKELLDQIRNFLSIATVTPDLNSTVNLSSQTVTFSISRRASASQPPDGVWPHSVRTAG
jgi:hypothetical protein